MLRVIKKLYQINLLTVKGFYSFSASVLSEGINLMAILGFSSKIYANRIAIHELEQSSTYLQLYTDSKRLAVLLKHKYGLKEHQKIALLCRNHLVAVQSLFALSRLGVNIYLLNIEMSALQLKKIIAEKKFDLIIYDEEKQADLDDTTGRRILSFHDQLPSIGSLLKSSESTALKLNKYKSGKIVVLTGGTTGDFKTAGRKPSITNFTNPFFALLTIIQINKFKSVYIGTPIYHGYGLATLIVSLLLGTEQFIAKKYKTEDACKLINTNAIEAVILVPLMLQRMLKHDKSSLSSLKCILSGGAPLEETLAQDTMNHLGNILFNLYGTSEAGFSILATPDDLQKHPATIGKPIQGVSIRILDTAYQKVPLGKVGLLCISSNWVMDNKKNRWVSTGDLGYMDKNGYVYLRGRSDNMIVSGGENVYPEELEQVLNKNEMIENASVIGIPDKEFGQRLKAFVVLKDNTNLTEEIILKWLSDKVARYQMPACIKIIETLPMTSTGKVDKKQLSLLN